MKQDIEIILAVVHKDKLLLKYQVSVKKYTFLKVEVARSSQIDEQISAFFQKNHKIIPHDVGIIGVYESDFEEVLYLIYRVEVDLEQYSKLSGGAYEFAWFDSVKLQNLTVADDLTNVIIGKFHKKFFQSDEVACSIDGSQKYILYTDGGSRGNPGHSAVGYAIYDAANNNLQEGGEYIGVAGSAVAEYQAVLKGLEMALSMGIKNLEVRVDNLMISKHMNGAYQVKNRELWPIHEKLMVLSTKFDKLKFVHIKREFNEIADRLVNKALDDYLTNT